MRYRFFFLILLLSSPLLATAFPTKISLGTLSQSLKVFHTNSTHSYKLHLTSFNTITYPFFGYEQGPLALGIGSVTHLSTNDSLFHSMFAKSGLSARLRLQNTSLRFLNLHNALYASFSLREMVYLSFLKESLSGKASMDSYVAGATLSFPESQPILNLFASTNVSSIEDAVQSYGYRFGVGFPWRFKTLSNSFQIMQLSQQRETPISPNYPSLFSYTTAFNKRLSEHRFLGSGTDTLIRNTLSLTTNENTYRIDVQSMPTVSAWIISLGADLALGNTIALQTQLQKESNVSGITCIAMIHFLHVFDWEV